MNRNQTIKQLGVYDSPVYRLPFTVYVFYCQAYTHPL